MRLQTIGPSVCAMLLVLGTTALPQQVSRPTGASPTIVQGTLIAPESSPFRLSAVITQGRDPAPVAYVEMLWVTPDKWRRTIQSDDFSQTLIVNGEKVSEQDSSDYFPLEIRSLVTAMVDPESILEEHRPEDRLVTKSNGRSDESGVLCLDENKKMCIAEPTGLTEIVGLPGHSLDFSSYQNFKGKRIARLITDTVGVGEYLKAHVSSLKELKDPDDSLFLVTQPTAKENQIRTTILQEADFRSLALEAPVIVWPQVLDGRTTGTASFYVSMDRTGRVREVLPIYTDNERSNDSARAQILRWKFRPIVKDGSPVQAESILTFKLDTRAWGPPAPLDDAAARKLASNIIDPVIPPGLAPPGSTYTLWAAIDADGKLIEVIPAEGIPGLFQPCYQALQKWHFSPILQDGEPRPYRAEIKFQVP
jgi:hypothetical protein